MFKRNEKHKQQDIFGWENAVPKSGKLVDSIWGTLRREVFEKVDEEAFQVLFRSHTARPNSPLNEVITLLVIKELFDWTFRELEEHMNLHIGVLYAVGHGIGESTVSRRTLNNFISYLREYEDQAGQDLFNKEFQRLVASQIKSFNVSAKIARTDSTQIGTNVIVYNRLQLVIDSIKRVYSIVDAIDKQFIDTLCPQYIMYEADNFVSLMTSSEVKKEFPQIGACILSMIEHFGDKYSEHHVWQIVIRIFEEQFDVKKDDKNKPSAGMKSCDDKTSEDIRAIDDIEATLRYKAGEHFTGYVGNAIETADSEANLNLISDVTLCPNNVSDGQMLSNVLDDLVKCRLTSLQELHFDGGYGGPTVDSQLMKHNIQCVQTGIRGVKCNASMHVEHDREQDKYYVSCVNNQRIACQRRRKGYNAGSDKELCNSCARKSECPIRLLKSGDYVYYIRDDDLPKRLRHSYIKTIPESRRTLRSGIEATIRQFKCKTKAGKTRLRGLFRHRLWFTTLALSINIKRIHNYTTCPT